MQQAWNLAGNSGQVGQDAQNAAQSGFLNTLSQTPNPINAAQISSTNLQPYMNPYTQSVINQTLPLMQQSNALQQNQLQDAAASSNAYGGSRQGVQQGVAQAQGAMNIGQMAAQLNQANYGQALGAAQYDVGQQNQVAAQNQQAGLTQEQLANAASTGLGNLGLQQMQNNIANYSMLAGAGGAEQQQQQNDINAQLAQFQQAWQYPQQQLGIMESALGMTPYDTATSGSSASTTQTTQNNPAATMLGGVQALTGLAGLFSGSDRRMKTDIKKVDTHHSGLPIYAYRYKGDPKHYPKVVGPMAEDVRKIAPHAVHALGTKGRLGVDMSVLNALPPSSPGVAKATSFMRPSKTPGILASNATPPTRAPILGAMAGV